jgi:hypothetical protein
MSDLGPKWGNVFSRCIASLAGLSDMFWVPEDFIHCPTKLRCPGFCFVPFLRPFFKCQFWNLGVRIRKVLFFLSFTRKMNRYDGSRHISQGSCSQQHRHTGFCTCKEHMQHMGRKRQGVEETGGSIKSLCAWGHGFYVGMESGHQFLPNAGDIWWNVHSCIKSPVRCPHPHPPTNVIPATEKPSQRQQWGPTAQQGLRQGDVQSLYSWPFSGYRPIFLGPSALASKCCFVDDRHWSLEFWQKQNKPTNK